MNNIKWMLCFQTMYDTIKYITDVQEIPVVVSYKDFLTLVSKFNLIEPVKFKDSLDKFRTLYINIPKHTWENYVVRNDGNTSFEELSRLNPDAVIRNSEIDKNKEKTILEKSKDFIENLTNKKKNLSNKGKYDDKFTKFR